ncbi:MAG: hypothetical protein Q8L48_39145 [Archangium sp.]|nr:hypothetical protein [Archangium sp.]
MKWAVLAAAVMVCLGAAWWALSDDPPQPGTVTAPLPAPQPSRPPPPPEREDFDPPPSPTPPAPSEVVVAPPPPMPAGIPTPRPPMQPIDPRQTALLDRARQEAKSEPDRALKTLVEFEQQFPLSYDAEVVRLEVLLRLGRRDEAEALGRELIAKDAAMKKPVERLLSRVRPR